MAISQPRRLSERLLNYITPYPDTALVKSESFISVLPKLRLVEKVLWSQNNGLWMTIKSYAKKSKNRQIAVAYIGKNASKILPLHKGDLLIADLSEQAVRSGQTYPHEVEKYIKKGVEVYNCPNLHAKLYIFDNTVIVSSANISTRSSQNELIEVGLISKDEQALRQAKEFIKELKEKGYPILLDEINQLKKIFAKQKSSTGRPKNRAMFNDIEEIVGKRKRHLQDVWQDVYKEFRDRLADREVAQKQAKKLIDRHFIKGKLRLSKKDMKELFNLLNVSYYNGNKPSLSRWGQMLIGRNLRLILQNNTAKLNRLIKQLYYDENYHAYDGKLKGIGLGFVSLFLYLKNPDKFAVMVPSATKNIEKYFPDTKFGNKPSISEYLLFNKCVNIIRKHVKGIDPRLLDVYLLHI